MRPRSSNRIVRLLFRLLARPDAHEFVLGDIEEEFRRDVLPRRGWLRARLWYWRHVLGSLRQTRRYLTSSGSTRRSLTSPKITVADSKEYSVDPLSSDLRYAVRRLAASPGFTVAAVLCVAVGVGANTTIFSLANGILLRPLPGVAEPECLLEVGRSQDGRDSDTFGYPSLDALRTGSRTTEIAGWTLAPMAIGGGSAAEAVLGAQVTDNYFDVLGVQLTQGRAFRPEETGPGSGVALVVISDSLWARRYQRDPEVVGREVRINGVPAVVVGIAEAGFAGTFSLLHVDAWVPIGMQASGLITDASLESWPSNFLLAVGKLRDDFSIEASQAELGEIMAAAVAEHPEALEGQGAVVNVLGTLPVMARSGARIFMLVMMVVVGLVLLVACVNVAGMMLARSLERGREVAVRLAVGASRGRLLRQLLTENLVLFGAGGAVGVLAAFWSTRLLLAFDPPTPPPFDVVFDASIDARVLGFSLAVTVLTGVLFGLGPALRASRGELVGALKDGGSWVVTDRARGRRALVVAQVALTVLLIVGSGLFLRALNDAASIQIGFDPTDVYALALNGNLSGLEPTEALDMLRELRRRTLGLPGVEAASFTALLPLGLSARIGFGGITVDGVDPPVDDGAWPANVNIVSPGYFETVDMPLVQGGDFDDGDIDGTLSMAVINARTAEFFWPGRQAPGQEFDMGGAMYTVRGVAADAKYASLTEDPEFFVYLPVAQAYRPQTNLLVRLTETPQLALAQVRSFAHELAPDMPVLQVLSLREYVEIAYLPQRVAAIVGGLLGIVAMLLAAVGMYGVTAQVAGQRTREIGVRMALGADVSDVRRLMVGQGMRAPLIGLGMGLVLALLLTRFLRSLLFGISPLDPVAFGGGIALLLVTALVANWLPARGASRVDPVQALRSE